MVILSPHAKDLLQGLGKPGPIGTRVGQDLRISNITDSLRTIFNYADIIKNQIERDI
jgi:hypothetical protein